MSRQPLTADAVYAYIHGLRGHRTVSVTTAQIERHFGDHGEHSRASVAAALNTLCSEGRVKIYPRSLNSVRKAKGAYVYEARCSCEVEP